MSSDVLLIPGRKLLSQGVLELSIVVIVIDTLKSIGFLSVIESNSYMSWSGFVVVFVF